MRGQKNIESESTTIGIDDLANSVISKIEGHSISGGCLNGQVQVEQEQANDALDMP